MSRSLVVVLALAGLTLEAWSAEPTPAARSCCEPRSLLAGCPDDYCRKPYPRIALASCGGPDDYCRKPCPRIWTLPCGGPDDYCRKPWPNLCRPLNAEHYTCGKVGCPAPGADAVRPAHVVQPVASAPVADKKAGKVR